ncbi:FAD-dependent monooxygenase [Pseudomonas lopnurensis]|uniref:FAD-dependent monooxygenase n=1 Tax=Pseudomonas lopnurensis TaxID=1477517 RepID=UPI0028A7CCBE|nr:FAD-dependent monooxygenase [Pseudomonas lopnurensis]
MKILIVGGGIAGFSVARALERKGYRPDLVERRLDEAPGGTGLFLPGNVARALDQLGLFEPVRDVAAVIATQRILDSEGRQLTVTRTQDVWAPCGPCLSLPRAALHGTLRGALSRTNLRFGVSVNEMQLSPGTCRVAFSDGTTSAYDLVIGADGVDSGVRRLVFPGIKPTYVGNVCWRFITRNTAAIEGWTAMLGHGQTLLAIPVSAEDVYVYADMALAEQDVEGMIAQTSLGALFGGFAEPVFSLVANVSADTRVHFGSIEQVVMDDWVKGRVVLIGDAAHASSPSMAEGAGMAIEDALVLAEAIAAIPDPDAALASYTARRRHRVDWVQKQCVARDKMRALPTPARNVILRLLGNRLYKRSYAPLVAPT